MKILHTVAGLWKTTGGPAASIPGLCRSLAERGHDVTLLTGKGRLAGEVSRASDLVSVATARLGPYSMANYSLEFSRACRREAAGCQLIHTHGVWLHPNWASAAAARRARRPLVISPRGMLEPWSLSRSKWRKWMLWRLREQRSFAGAALVHATSATEAESVRRLGVRTAIAIIPNGVDLEVEFDRTKIESIRERRSREESSTKTVLFLSRIHPKKGLDLLLDAWAGSAATRSAAKLIICGGGESGHVAGLVRRLEQETGERVEYLGPVDGERKLELLTGAQVVVLPSLSENYGMVIAEALACGTPVVTTTETPWRAIAERNCGWWIRPEVGEVLQALEAAIALSDGERLEMGERGRALIEEEHSLARSAEMMEAAYLWLLNRNEKPTWVHDRVAA